MPKLIIDGREIDAEDGITVIQACEQAGVEVPRFCYHERLSIAGNCRMCLVEAVGAPKPIASCAFGVNDLRPGPKGEPPEIRTNSPLVKAAREGVMEFLLINHPLDCPICDQGGECDLQDQAMSYGVDSSRYQENKRAVEDKYIGPLVKTIMTRCIHCTRCVRFMTEIAGVEEIGLIGRGEDAEITTYLEAGLSSEMQGNVIDLCPVGALTSKPYAFAARPWELRKTESIDVMDAVGSNIRIDTRGREVMRILPRNNDAVNEEWISDKTRYIWDGLKTQRLDRPYLRENGRLRPATWGEALAAVAARIDATAPARIGVITGDLAGAEEMFALADLMSRHGVSSIDCRQDGAALDPALGRGSYIFNTTIAGIEDADAVLLIGSNPRLEAPVLNTRLRKIWRNNGVRIGLIGQPADLTYDVDYLGAGSDSLARLLISENGFLNVLQGAKRPLIIVGQAALRSSEGAQVLAAAARLAHNLNAVRDDWNGFNVLHTAAARVGALDLGLVPAEGGRNVAQILSGAGRGEVELVYLLGADEIDTSALGEAFVVYQGSHGDRGAHRADVILPGAAYTEKDATYVNTEGRVQLALRAAFPPGEAKEDWAIVRALSATLEAPLPYDTLAQLRAAMYAAVPGLGRIDTLDEGNARDGVARLAASEPVLSAETFGAAFADFYLTNPIARASAVMAELSALRAGMAVAAE